MNKDKVVAALDGKPLARGVLWSTVYECGCAVGQLLVDAGVPKEEITGCVLPNTDQAALLEREYGLSMRECDTLISANDNIFSGADLHRRSGILVSLLQDEDSSLNVKLKVINGPA